MSEQPTGRIDGIRTIGVPLTDQDKAIGHVLRHRHPLPASFSAGLVLPGAALATP
jgi:hypothetical protein